MIALEIIEIEDSLGFLVPEEILVELGVGAGSTLYLHPGPGKSMVLSTTEHSAVGGD
jgi:hypothetical protein